MSVLWPIVFQSLRKPRRIAAIDDRGSHSRAKLLGGSLFLAEYIENATDKPHVGILLPNGAGYAMAMLGCWMARRVVVPLNYLLSPDDLNYVIEDSGVDCVLTAGALLDALDLNKSIPRHVKRLDLEKLDFSGMPSLRWPPRYSDDDLAAIIYTSGTSGKPKGVMLTHGNFESNVRAGIRHVNVTEMDTIFTPLPQFHCFGLTDGTIVPLLAGAKVIYTARFMPRRIVELIRMHRPDLMLAVPSMYGALLTVKDASAEDFSSLRLPISGGEPLSAELADQFHERYGLRLLEGYGLTETSPAVSWCTAERYKPGSVGPPLPGIIVRVVDNDNNFLPPGQIGEILIAGPLVMKGYYNLPRQTDEAIIHLTDPITGRTERFFRTGDLGRVDDEGYIYITGRKKEMMIIGGENVFPREIEEVLARHPSVRDVAVIGRPDQTRGEIPVAFVEIHEDKEFDETALRSHCRESLATFKVPRHIYQVEELPRSPTGKILRRKLPET